MTLASQAAARVDNAQEVYDWLGEIIATRTAADWKKALNEYAIPVTEVNGMKTCWMNSWQLAVLAH